HLGLLPAACEIALLGCDDSRIATLNTEFRAKPTPTNVLSWPDQALAAQDDGATPDRPKSDPHAPDEPLFLGDIAISYDTCAREAADQAKPIADHITHLIAHATLHLLGYDHIRDQDATLMEALEVEILGKMGIANPY
ncbi:rRNA maturation RNase YbeY, partial [uncultured Lentibacter sp.]|uniref:rRNA maturation RNase YbeY n=1 Tax=uncultured Lentibacter sp. TaxID=1659309 RepID=UPI002630BC5D